MSDRDKWTNALRVHDYILTENLRKRLEQMSDPVGNTDAQKINAVVLQNPVLAPFKTQILQDIGAVTQAFGQKPWSELRQAILDSYKAQLEAATTAKLKGGEPQYDANVRALFDVLEKIKVEDLDDARKKGKLEEFLRDKVEAQWPGTRVLRAEGGQYNPVAAQPYQPYDPNQPAWSSGPSGPDPFAPQSPDPQAQQPGESEAMFAAAKKQQPDIFDLAQWRGSVVDPQRLNMLLQRARAIDESIDAYSRAVQQYLGELNVSEDQKVETMRKKNSQFVRHVLFEMEDRMRYKKARFRRLHSLRTFWDKQQ